MFAGLCSQIQSRVYNETLWMSNMLLLWGTFVQHSLLNPWAGYPLVQVIPVLCAAACAAPGEWELGQVQLERTVLLVAVLSSLTSKTMAGLKCGILCINAHAPWIQGEKTLLQADFAQPVSDVFQNTSEEVKSSQYLVTQGNGPQSLFGRNKANTKISTRDVPFKQIHHWLSCINNN